jgi:hypothetical protein
LSTIPDIPTKLGAARTRLILERPFIGALVMHLPLVPVAAGRCETVATDARALYYNPEYIAALTLAEVQFVLAHEAMHCALGHFARRAHRVRRRWDVACDHAVNLLLVDDGLKPPPGALANPDFRGLSAEEIYPLIPHEPAESTLDRHLFDGHEADAFRSTGHGRRRAPARFRTRCPAGTGARLDGARNSRWQTASSPPRSSAAPAGLLILGCGWWTGRSSRSCHGACCWPIS